MIKKGYIFYCLFAVNLAVLLMPMLVSCGKTDTANPTGINVQLQVANLSPNAYPVELFSNNLRINAAYRYNVTPSYFYLTDTGHPLQIRSTRVGDSLRIFSRDTINFIPNTRYTLFFTGLYPDSLRSIVTVDDTASLPPVGQGGKIRFVNASPRSGSLDVWANGIPALKNTDFGKVSGYVTLPAGNYNFRVYTANTSAKSLTDLNGVTIQDGRLYTLYSRGMVGRTDSATFSIAVLANNPPKL